MKHRKNKMKFLLCLVIITAILAGHTQSFMAETVDYETAESEVDTPETTNPDTADYETSEPEIGVAVPEETDYLDPDFIGHGPIVDLDVIGISYYMQARELLDKINEYRARYELEPLVFNLQLEDMALQRAVETSVMFGNMRPNGEYLYLENSDINGENIVGGIIDVDSVFEYMLHTPNHFFNMINNDFNSVGVAAYGSLHGEAPRWWTTLYSKNLPENKMPDRINGAVISHRIKVNPEYLRMQIRTSGELNEYTYASDGEVLESISMYPGMKTQLYALVHYFVKDSFHMPSSLSFENLIWENSNSSVVKIEPNGVLTAKSAGEAIIQVAHKQYPELKAKLKVQVSPVDLVRVMGSIDEDKVEELYENSKQIYAELPSVSEVEGEVSEEDFPLSEFSYRLYDELTANSKLQSLAYELAKQYSFYTGSEAEERLPGLTEIKDNLPLGQRISWKAYRSSDLLSFQEIKVPGWARSMAAVALTTGVQETYVVVFSSAEGDDGRTLYRSIIPEADISRASPDIIAFEVKVFSDQNDLRMVFLDQGLEVQRIDFAAGDERVTLNDLGQVIYKPEVMLLHEVGGNPGKLKPATYSLLYKVDESDLASFTDEGSLLIKSSGTFTLTAELIELQTNKVLETATVEINNYIEIPEVEETEP